MSDLYVNKIAPQAKATQAAAEKARVQLQTSFGEARTATESSIARTVTIQEIIAALTLLIGGLIAFFLARGVSNPITALTQSMREMAAGNFDVVLPGLARKDEVGNIARAVDEFKVRAALHCLVDERPGEHQPAQPFARERGDFSSNRHPAPPSICA